MESLGRWGDFKTSSGEEVQRTPELRRTETSNIWSKSLGRMPYLRPGPKSKTRKMLRKIICDLAKSALSRF